MAKNQIYSHVIQANSNKKKNIKLEILMYNTRSNQNLIHSNHVMKADQTFVSNERLKVKVLIVGLGPAGTACGMGLARRSISVLALDRAYFPRDKICGDALPLFAQGLVNHLGINDRAPEMLCHSEIFERGSIHAKKIMHGKSIPGWRINVDGVQTQKPCLQAVKRFDLDNWLVDCCANRQLPMRFGWQVQKMRWEETLKQWLVEGKINSPDGVKVGQFLVAAEIVVGCDGAASTIQRHCRRINDRQPHALASRFYLKSPDDLCISRNKDCLISRIDYRWPGETSYAWAFAVPGGFNCGVAAMPLPMTPTPKRGFELLQLTRDWSKEIKQLVSSSIIQPSLIHTHQDVQISTMAIPVIHPSHQQRPPAGIMLTGDAASLVDPHQGHGIDRALESGGLAASVIRQGIEEGHGPERMTQHYQARLEARTRKWRKGWQQLKCEYNEER